MECRLKATGSLVEGLGNFNRTIVECRLFFYIIKLVGLFILIEP